MILSNDFKTRQNFSYKATIESLEKARDLLNKRYNNKEISTSEYVKRCKEIEDNIRKYKNLLNNF